MITRELESQLWAAEFLRSAGIEQGGQRLSRQRGAKGAYLRRSVRIREMA